MGKAKAATATAMATATATGTFVSTATATNTAIIQSVNYVVREEKQQRSNLPGGSSGKDFLVIQSEVMMFASPSVRQRREKTWRRPSVEPV